MRKIVAIVFLSFAAVCASHAADDDIQKGIFNSYLKQAADGDAVAQYVVAQSYENGRGTEKNLEKAYHWYEMAAKQNYPLAVVKIEERNNKEQAKAEAARSEKPEAAKPEPAAKAVPAKHVLEKNPEPPHRQVAAKPKAKPTKAPVAPTHVLPPVKASKPAPAEPIIRAEAPKQETKFPATQDTKFPATEVVAKATVAEEPPRPAINVIQALLGGKWERNRQDAEFLPSSRAACLQSSSAEVVCFSQELTRNVDNTGLTYNVKSVISGINNKDAKFNLRYIYNVVDIAGRPYPQPSGMPGESNDIIAKTGWQEPGISMECHLRDEHSLTCTGADRKMTYQFVRE